MSAVVRRAATLTTGVDDLAGLVAAARLAGAGFALATTFDDEGAAAFTAGCAGRERALTCTVRALADAFVGADRAATARPAVRERLATAGLRDREREFRAMAAAG